MEHSIGVGAIVGLVFASSIYVWNNDKFTKEQKTGLLICIIFPPAQWLGILIVLVYNNYIENNSVEKATERKTEQKTNTLNSQVESLKDLKEKGILTEEEYKTKVEKIEKEKEEQNLKNSLEYKQLKNLFDSGILTKEEFESKIKLIQNVPEKEVDTKEINKILDSANKLYLEPLEEKAEYNKFDSTYFYIGTVLFCVLSIVGMFIYSYYNKRNEIVLPSIETAPNYKVDSYNPSYQEPNANKKFVYIIMKIKKPKLDVFEPMSYTNTLGYIVTSEPSYSLNFENETYITEIIEIENYNEDEKYKAMDNAKNKMHSKLSLDDSVYSSNLWVNCKDDAKREEFQKITSKIVDTQIYEFNSYSEASISKEKRD